MFSSGCQKVSARPFASSCLMVLCFLVLVFTYYKSEIKFRPFGINMERDSYLYPTALCAKEAQTQASNSNCSSEKLINPPHSDTQKIQGAAADAALDTVVLIWMWPFGKRFDLSCSMFNITRCHLTGDKSLYHKAHGVLFHHRDLHGDIKGLPKEPRPRFQKWVWFNMESPANTAQIPELNHLFNLTSTYRLDSNIPVPYGYLEPQTSDDESFDLPAKKRLVCWIVSNWNGKQKRVEFYTELKKHIKIDPYGQAFNHPVGDQDYLEIVSSCKFYLSFENSVYIDYITEKLYRPMMLGSVPIVLGPPRQNYEDHIPADSFIHVNDFSTLKELADRLLYLDRNNTEYMKYFSWKKSFKVKTSWFGKEHACRTCGYLQKHRGYQAFHNLNKWFWS